MTDKTYRIPADQIRRLVTCGVGIATDAITVDGGSVGLMQRDEPRNDSDSGWWFLAGTESQAYLDDAANSAVYEVNTIANYDPEIVRFLTYPVGTRVSRPAPGEPLRVEGDVEEPSMTFLLPYQAGVHREIGGGWSLTPPGHMLRRVEDGRRVLWRPKVTFFLNRFEAPEGRSVDEWLKGLREDASPDRTDEVIRTGPLTSLRYRLVETEPGGEQASLYLCTRAGDAILHITGYFDDDESEALVEALFASLTHASAS